MEELLKKTSGASQPAGVIRSHDDLASQIDEKNVECLNESPSQNVRNCLLSPQRESEAVLLSEDDEQLLIKIPFKQIVRITGICFSAAAELPEESSAPKSVRLFVNSPNIDFAEAESHPAAQEFELSTEDVMLGKRIPLKAVKFSNVTSLAIFVQSNQGDTDFTAMSRLLLIGVAAGEQFGELKKIEVQDD